MDTKIAGPVLATIMYELANSESDKEGLLFGRIEHREVTTMCDTSDEHLTEVVRTMVIDEVAACHNVNGLCSSDGSVNEEAFEEMLSVDARQKLVGWFRFRRCARERPSIREERLHKELCSHSPMSSIDDFVFNIWSWKSEENTSLQSYSYRFFRTVNGVHTPAPMSIVNLEPIRRLTYKDSPSSAQACRTASEIISSCLGTHMVDSRSSVERSYLELLQELKKSAETISEEGSSLSALDEEVRELRRQVREEENSFALMTDGSSSDDVAAPMRATLAEIASLPSSGRSSANGVVHDDAEPVVKKIRKAEPPDCGVVSVEV